mgnify:FL=1
MVHVEMCIYDKGYCKLCNETSCSVVAGHYFVVKIYFDLLHHALLILIRGYNKARVRRKVILAHTERC